MSISNDCSGANFVIKSLNQYLGRESTQLAELSAILASLNPADIHSLEEFARKILENLPSSEEIENTDHLLRKLAIKQFANPVTEAIREIISNALDAQQRANATSMSIEITMKNQAITVADPGDGIGYETLGHLLVGGRSSNPLAIFSLDKGMANVTGRFGQGALSAFYFLLDHTLRNANDVPAFSQEGELRSLRIPYVLSGKKQVAVFTLNKEQNRVLVTSHEAQEVRKITIDTARGGRRMKLKFFERAGKIYVDIFNKECQSPLRGTRFKIVSPLIEAKSADIIESIHRYFENVLSTRIFLNGTRINHANENHVIVPALSRMLKSLPLKELSFDWGTVAFSVPSKNRTCSLSICEGGKQICQYSQKDSYVVERMVISFHSLKLTHDRSSIDFQDPQLMERINQASMEIINSKELTPQQKSAILNSLYPLIVENRCNLVQPLATFLQTQSYRLLPDLPEFKAMDQQNTLFLNPKYIKTIRERSFYQNGNTIYHWLDADLPVPAAICKLGPNRHYFLDSRLNFPASETYTMFNLFLFNQWIEQIDPFDRLPLEKIFSTNKAEKQMLDRARVISASSNTHSGLFLIDLKAYGIDLSKNSDKIQINRLDPQFIEELDQSASSLYQAEVRTEVKQVLIMLEQVSPNTVKYLYHVFCQDGELREFYADKRKIKANSSYLGACPIEGLDYIFTHTKAFLQAHPEEAHSYKQYIFNRLGQFKELPSANFFSDEVYWKFKRLVEASSYPEFIDQLSERESYPFERIEDDHIELISLMPAELKKELLPKIWKFQNVSYLLQQPTFTTARILNICNRLEDFIVNSEIYDLIIALEGHFSSEKYESIFLDNEASKSMLIALCLSLESSFFAAMILPLKLTNKKILDFIDSFIEKVSSEDNQQELDAWIYGNFSNIKGLASLCSGYKSLINNICRSFNVSRKSQNFFTYIETISKNDSPEQKADFKKKIDFVLALYEAKEAYSSHKNLITFRDTLMALIGKLNLVPARTLDLISGVCSLGQKEFLSLDYAFPQLPRESVPIPLHKDLDVLESVKNEELAASRIQSAIKQSNRSYSCLAELIKNAEEAEASKIAIEVHTDKSGCLYVVITDDGQGMGPKEFKALKTPWKTTKRQEADNDPNFGWGFFSAFHDFQSVYVASSQEGVALTEVIFDNQNDMLTIQQASKAVVGVKGTKLVLKKLTKNAEIEFIHLKMFLTSLCRYKNSICVTLQGINISSSTLKKGNLIHQEKYDVNGINKGWIEYSMSRLENGLFWKNMRLGSYPEEALDLLPSSLKEALYGEQRLCIFLPEAEENMNRNQLISNEQLIPILQRGALAIAMRFYLNERLQKGRLKEISEDFWDDFRVSYEVVDPSLKALIEALAAKDWTKALDHQVCQNERCVLEVAKAYFMNCQAKEGIYFPKNHSIDEWIAVIGQSNTVRHLNHLNETIKTLLADPRNFAAVLIHLPLKEGGPSLFEIREEFQNALENEDLLENGKFSEDFADLDIQDASDTIDECINAVDENLNLNDSYLTILQQFKKGALAYISRIKSQQALDTTLADNSFEPLKRFIEKVAGEILGRSPQIIFYSKADNRAAYTTKGSKVIYINQKSPAMIFLSKWFPSIGKNSSKLLELTSVEIGHLVELLETLCHELVHQDENADCSSTHDETFRELLSKFLERLFIRPQDKNHCLQILQPG